MRVLEGWHTSNLLANMQETQAEGVLAAECAAAGGQCRDGSSLHSGLVAGWVADTGLGCEPYGGPQCRGSDSPGQQSQQQDDRPEPVVAPGYFSVRQLWYASCRKR